MIETENLLEKKTNYHPVSPIDLLAFEEAMKGWLGVHYVPFLVKDESNIGVAKLSFICIGTVVGNDTPNGIYKITIQKVTSRDSKWEKVGLDLLLPINEEFTIEPLTIYDIENFYKMYPPKLGVSQFPICKVHVGKQIGGMNYYLVEKTIVAPPFTPTYLLLPMEH